MSANYDMKYERFWALSQTGHHPETPW